MPRRKWTEELFDVIREKAQNMTDEALAHEIVKLTGKVMTLGAVRKMRQRIGVKKVGGRTPHVISDVNVVKEEHPMDKLPECTSLPYITTVPGGAIGDVSRLVDADFT